jgi:hypothetical protein
MASIIVDKEIIEDCETLTVYWETGSSQLHGAWIGAYPAEDEQFRIHISTDDAPTGTVQFEVEANDHFGEWEIRYYASTDATQPLAVAIVTVLPTSLQIPVELGADTSLVHDGGYITISWNANHKVNTRHGAWIGLFPANTPSTESRLYTYTDSELQYEKAIQIIADNAFGEWEARYFASGTSYEPLAIVTFHVVPGWDRPDVQLRATDTAIDGTTITVRWDAVDESNVQVGSWIGLFRTGSDSTDFVTWVATEDEVEGSLKLFVDVKGMVGDYEIRYFGALGSNQPLSVIPLKVVS